MPFDGNGNWTSNFSAVADRNANIKIEASRFDNILLADIAQSFENCLTKDMQVKPQQNFDANNFRLTNVADPVIGSDAVNLSTLNTKDGTAVHKTGTETIIGAKTFSGNITSSGTNTWTGSNTFSGSVSLGALATATSPSASDSSTKVATTAWANNTSNNLVHKSGNEAIDGYKGFLKNITVRSDVDESLGTAQEKNWFVLEEANGTTTAAYIRQYWTSTYNQLRYRVLGRHGDYNNAWADIQQEISSTGNYRVKIFCQPTLTNTALTETSSSTTNPDIPTKGWVNNPATSTNVVHRTGYESVDGIKTFTSQINIGNISEYRKSIYEQQSGNFTIVMNKQDNSGFMSYINMSTDGRVIINAGDATATNREISLQADSVIAPTPSTSDNSTKIATTEWFNNKKSDIAKFVMPNYGAGVSKSASTNYTETSNGFLYVSVQRASGSQGTMSLKIGSNTFEIKSNDYSWDSLMFPISRGITYSYTLSNISNHTVTFYPCYGG